jgi:RecB family exonuclease
MPRSRNLFDPESTKPYKISRSGLELFHDCPRCFYFDKRLGLSRPPGFPFNLNSAVDALLKREFDAFRRQRKPHPLMEKAGIDAIPFAHPDLEKWRTNFTGVQALHKPTNMLVTGAVDDLWENARGELIVVDYKSTAKAAEITELNEEWHSGYKRQIEIYQWLLRQNGFKVSPTAYWVYANGDAAADQFDQTLRFRMTVISYDGSDDWVEPHIMAARDCLMNETPPAPATKCPHCSFAAERQAHAAKAN